MYIFRRGKISYNRKRNHSSKLRLQRILLYVRDDYQNSFKNHTKYDLKLVKVCTVEQIRTFKTPKHL